MMLTQRSTYLPATSHRLSMPLRQPENGDRRHDESSQQNDVLAQVSHDIRLPVSNVVGMADLLMATDLSEKQREYLGLLRISADAALCLVNHLLDLKRMDADGLTLEEVTFDLPGCLEQTLKLLQPAAAAKGLQLCCHIQSGVPLKVIGDPLRLRQVIMNLLDNAVKFTRQGGVTLQVRQIACNSSHSRLHFAIVDSGTGIPVDRQAQVFAPFVQAQASTARHYGGSGLGLAIVAGLVDKMGGTIVLESEPGQGSVFQFGLDFDLPRDLPRALPADVLPSDSLRILIADDDPVSRELARHVLQNAGHLVSCVSDGMQAVTLVKSKPFDLLLMDLQMPGMGGLAATRLIRQRNKSDQPLLIMALSASVGDTRRCLQAGMDDCLLKPLNADSVACAIERARIPVIEWSSLLERVSGDKLLLAEIVTLFAARSKVLLADARAALEAGDSARLGPIMHTLTGMFLTLSAEAARLATEAFRRSGTEPGGDSIPAFYRLECEVDRLGFALAEFIKEAN